MALTHLQYHMQILAMFRGLAWQSQWLIRCLRQCFIVVKYTKHRIYHLKSIHQCRWIYSSSCAISKSIYLKNSPSWQRKKINIFKGPLIYLGHCIRTGYILNIFNTKEITFWPLESWTKDGIVYLIVHDSIKSFCHEFLYFLSIQNRFQTRQL